MSQPLSTPDPSGDNPLKGSSLWSALINRRSRRFGAGMKMPEGPLAFESRFDPVPLSDSEEAALTFSASGISGRVLADLSFGKAQGGNIMVGLVGRTIASGDGIQSVSLAVTNDNATYLIKRPQELLADEVIGLIDLAKNGRLSEIYQRQRVRLKSARSAPPVEPLMNINVNRWSANAAGSTTFVPLNDLSLLYINGLLEIFNEETGAFILDERASFRPAGIGQFARSKGGHLEDDPAKGKLATVKHVELMVAEFASIEQGLMLQNLALTCEALGLGGFPYFANHETAWFDAFGFEMATMPASRYLGMNALIGGVMRLLGKDSPVRYPIGLNHGGEPLLKPFCPPAYPSMRNAVEAVVERKFGTTGTFSKDNKLNAWSNPDQVGTRTPRISEKAIEATVAYCEYLWKRYGRFPAHIPAYRTVMAFQAAHLDAEFYDKFYQPDALTQTHRDDFAKWSGKPRMDTNSH